MTFEELADSIRDQLRGKPGVTVVERTNERRATCRCAECDKVIRYGGTGLKLELCRDCNPGEE